MFKHLLKRYRDILAIAFLLQSLLFWWQVYLRFRLLGEHFTAHHLFRLGIVWIVGFPVSMMIGLIVGDTIRRRRERRDGRG